MIEDCIIIGGGVAGLSVANQLADAELSPLIIEASKFPAHRVCGEFLSHECLPILQQWDIPILNQIDVCRFFSGNTKVEFNLETANLARQSGSCSRYILDSMLLERAKKKGARALTETTVVSMNLPENSSGNYELVLSNGQTIYARHLMIGTGRIPRMPGVKQDVNLKYMGFKAHFEGVSTGKGVEIHAFDGGYLGISNVDANTTNVACIVNKNCLKEMQQPERFMQKLQEDKSLPFFNERMVNARIIFPNWLIGQIPEFGIRKNPSWERVFWIGDAAGSIPPICGDGLAIAITSGCMAADYYLNSNAGEFKKAWMKRYRQRFFIAKLLHKMMIHPKMSRIALTVGNSVPGLPNLLWKLTREE